MVDPNAVLIGSIVAFIALTIILVFYCVNNHIKRKRGLKEKATGIGWVIPTIVILMVVCILFVFFGSFLL